MVEGEAARDSAGAAAAGHYVALDGLRGVAALGVVIYHGSALIGANGVLREGSLAVDFFFLLSGFVLDAAYGARLRGAMGFARYALRRAVRLYPMILAGALLGLVWTACGHRPDQGPRTWPLAFGAAVLGLPTRHLAQGWTFYPLDPPEWSLSYEIALSMAFGAWARWLAGRALPAILAVSAVAFLIQHATFDPDVVTGRTQLWQAARLGFPFVLGVALHRWRATWPAWRAPAIGLSLALALSFVPPPGGRMWIYEVACVAALYPLILIGGLGCRPGPRAALALALAGRLSYPLYLVHWPVFGLVLLAVGGKPQGRWMVGVDLAVGVAAALTVAALALRLWDEPVRRRLGAWVQRLEAPRRAAVEVQA